MTEVVEEHKEGFPWTIAARFKTFEEAEKKKEELLSEDDLHVKIRWMRRRDDFAVKTRVDPAVESERLLQETREAKKRRKKKLQKKRRKK